MASINSSKIEFASSSLNRVQELPKYQPNSSIATAITMLTGVGEGEPDLSGVSIIPVDLSGSNSILIRFKKPVNPSISKAKGLDNHELRIQRLSDTEPRTEDLDRASRDGFDTGHDALIASMDGNNQSYFSADIQPSQQLIKVKARNTDLVEVPLYIPILFFGPTGKKCVAVITRFPKEYLKVETSKSIDQPFGVITVDENKIVRPPVASTSNSTFQWALPGNSSQDVVDDNPIQIPTLPADGHPDVVRIDFNKIESDRAAKTPIETIVSGLDKVKRTREAKRLIRVLDNTEVDAQQRQVALDTWKRESRVSNEPADSSTVLFGEIAVNIIQFQNNLDTADRTHGSMSWIMFTTGRFVDAFINAWRVDVEKVKKTLDYYHQQYQRGPVEDRRKNFVEYATLKHILDSEWVLYKKWKD